MVGGGSKRNCLLGIVGLGGAPFGGKSGGEKFYWLGGLTIKK